jgi:hypothetical protein
MFSSPRFGLRAALLALALVPPVVVVVGPAVVRLLGYHLIALLGAAICVWSLVLCKRPREPDDA